MALPAPSAPPWKRLGEDLVATLAWLWLKGRELWRRNGEGSLPTPAVWPRRGARLFWPLILVLSLLAVAGLTRLAWQRARPAVVPEASVPSDTRARSAGEASPEPEPNSAPDSALDAELEAARDAELEATAEDATGPATEGDATTALETERQPPPTPEDGAAPLEEPAPPLWTGEDPERWIAASSAEPASATLTLRLNSDFTARTAAERQRWAERWREQAAEQGYTHLRLLAANGRLLGREAQVGGGMILFEPLGGRPDAG